LRVKAVCIGNQTLYAVRNKQVFKERLNAGVEVRKQRFEVSWKTIPRLWSSTITGQNIQSQQPLKQLSSFRQLLVAAVYIDQHGRDIRSSSFIISGLPLSVVHSDKYIVMERCSNEFNIQVDIVSTKCLGKTSPSSNKIQPLLVHVNNVDHAKQIISSARQMRQYIASLVRDNVYINQNVTKAAASAAYELRCRHREAANRRSTAGARPVGHLAHQRFMSHILTPRTYIHHVDFGVDSFDFKNADWTNLSAYFDCVDYFSSFENCTDTESIFSTFYSILS